MRYGCAQMSGTTASRVEKMLVEVRAQAPRVQDRTVEGLRRVAEGVALGKPVLEAVRDAGVAARTFKEWRARFPSFGSFVDAAAAAGREARAAEREQARFESKRAAGLVFDPSAPVPPAPGLAAFRWDYFGQPTEPHQEAAVAALEDMSNRVVIILGPTGMGKDTIAGQYLLWRLVPTRQGLRGAWFMESEEQSKKRLYRLSRYLVDQSAYRRRPEFTPGGQIPTRSLITDWGPFKWESGMVHADGTPVDRPPWTSHSMYFLQDIAPEQDPNLWATGVGGATYGARIQEAVLSDIFTDKNQNSPTDRARQLTWVLGTLDTRLDEIGRLVVLGTMLPMENNYEPLIARYTDGARVLRSQQLGPGTYTKYSNGTGVVIIKAIVNDDQGDEVSFWPGRFPLESHLLVDGRRVPVDEFTDDERLEMADAGKPVKFIIGLRDRRQRDPRIFRAMFQQERDADSTGDFTEATWKAMLDPTRTWEVSRPTELKVVGVDPGQYYGAAYGVLAIDRDQGTITCVDEFWGNRLGVSGIKQHLILRPLSRWEPIWLAYEVNRHGAILDDALIRQAIMDFGVSVYEHKTSGQNRADHEIGPGAIATYGRMGIFKLPAMTSRDRERSREVWNHFTAYDQATLAAGRRRPGDSQHRPDDRLFAFWPAFIKARVILERDTNRGRLPGIPVPLGIRTKWDRYQKTQAAARAGRDGTTKQQRRADLTESPRATAASFLLEALRD